MNDRAVTGAAVDAQDRSVPPWFLTAHREPLRVQVRHSAGRSNWYYLGPALMVFATFATFRHRGMEDLFESGTDMEIKLKLVIWALLGLIALQRLPTILRNSSLLSTLPLAPYVAFCALALGSTIYSVDPALSGVRAGQIAVTIALGLSMVDRAPEWTRLGALYLAINWAFLLIGLTGLIPALDWRNLPGFQEAGYDGINSPWRFGTPIGHFSIISLVAAMLAVAHIARIQREITLRDTAYLLWLLTTILLTVSRTGILGAVLGVAVVLVLRGGFALFALITTAGTSALLLMPGEMDSIIQFLDRGQDAQALESLTGRTGIYDSALADISRSWVIGYGFRASRAEHLNEIRDSLGNAYGIVAHAHNAVLESTVSLGVMGALCAITILLSMLLCALALMRRPRHSPPEWSGGRRAAAAPAAAQLTERSRAIEFCAYWPPIFVFSMMDSSFALEINPFVFCFIAVMLDFTQHRSSVLRPDPETSAAASSDRGVRSG